MQGILTKVRKERETGLQVGLGSRVGEVERRGFGSCKVEVPWVSRWSYLPGRSMNYES